MTWKQLLAERKVQPRRTSKQELDALRAEYVLGEEEPMGRHQIAVHTTPQLRFVPCEQVHDISSFANWEHMKSGLERVESVPLFVQGQNVRGTRHAAGDCGSVLRLDRRSRQNSRRLACRCLYSLGDLYT